MTEIRSSDKISTKLQRIAELSRKHRKRAFTSLACRIDVEFLREAYRRTRKSGATGIDGQSAAQYAENLDENLADLHERFMSGRYRAPPVRRVFIPKGKGKERPIGIPTFEDKVLQRAVTMMLEVIYEEDFHDFSYGFRPGRSAHDALSAFWKGTMNTRGGWVIELDIQSFFDVLDHQQLRAFLDRRVTDGVIRRTIGKWLNAGVMAEGSILRSPVGTPQGGVISPLLANVYLHEVLDSWFVKDVKPRLKGQSFMVRYADDAVLVFETEDDARRVFNVLARRFDKFGLTLHPDKTRMRRFKPPRGRKGRDAPVELLGFTLHWAKSRKNYDVVRRKTSGKSFRRSVANVKSWCFENMHTPIPFQYKNLCWKLRGHYGYFGETGNAASLERFFYIVRRIWFKTLSRRTNRGAITWEEYVSILRRFPLPTPIVVRSIYRTTANP